MLRDKTRPLGIAPLKPELVEKVVALTLEPPGHEATHWTVRAMAKAIADQFGARVAEVHQLFRGTLDDGRTRELIDEMRVAGRPV